MLFFGEANSYNFELFYLNSVKETAGRNGKTKSSQKYKSGFGKIEADGT